MRQKKAPVDVGPYPGLVGTTAYEGSMTEHGNDRQPWGKIHRSVSAAPIGANDFRVYIAIASYANKHRQCWPKVSQLADDTGLSERSVKRATHNLEEACLIKKVANLGRGRPSRYILLDPNPTPKGGTRRTHSDTKKGVARDTAFDRKGCHLPSPFTNPERVSPTGPAIEHTSIGKGQGNLGQQEQEGKPVVRLRLVAGGER